MSCSQTRWADVRPTAHNPGASAYPRLIASSKCIRLRAFAPGWPNQPLGASQRFSRCAAPSRETARSQLQQVYSASSNSVEVNVASSSERDPADPATWAPLNGMTAVVVGAGPAGCTLAMYLARQGALVYV